MRRMVVHCYLDHVGMDSVEALLVEDDATQEEIDEQAWQMALDNADMYGYYPPDWANEDEEDEDCVDHGIGGTAEDYDPDKHDMLRSG